jgi:hypothetical protein
VYGLLAWGFSRIWAPEAVATSAARQWPGGMGTLDDVAARLPPLKANDASVKLTELANALPKSESIGDYVRNEIARGELTIGEPPVLPDVSAIRELLLREPVVWERHPGIDREETVAMRAVELTAARALVASALNRARAHDPLAWEDLHAAGTLTRALDAHPQMMAQTAALSMSRMINAVAWKMPLPVPPWLSELQERDNVRPLLESFQYVVSSYWSDGGRFLPTKWLASSVEHDRLIAEEVFKLARCGDVRLPMNEMGTDLTSVWRRAFRYRAEREATANALRVREGKPIETASRCSDGGWTLDGTTLRFSREIATPAPDRPMPLVLQIKP